MKSRVLPIVISLIIATILITAACSAGFIVGRMVDTGSPQALIQPPSLPGFSNRSTGSDAGTPEDLQELFGPFWQAWDLVHDQYVDQPVDDQALMRGAIDGMLEALGDEHTSYLIPEHYEMFTSQLEGEYEGIGAWVDVRGEYLTIISPMQGSPAEKAGLRPGDQIVAVDGQDMTGVDAELVRREVIGPEGTSVNLTIKREGMEETFEITVERASITVPSVEAQVLEGDIAYVRLHTFGEDTTEDLRAALRDLMANNPTGLVLDLRNNGGGYRDTGIEVASQFIETGVIMFEEHGDGSRDTFDARGDGLATDIPMVVLINQGSASASEIVAGAIQDHGRGQLVGETSFGKGSVQIFTRLKDDQGGVRITISRWLTPDGKTIHDVGLEPDVPVELTEEDFQAGRDPQLDKAVELLTNP
jgi:carboxyl-terminal processing protease